MFFGVMGIILPYFNLYCYHLKFTGIQIGYIASLRSLCMLFLPIFWGIIADRYQNRKFLYVLCCCCNALFTAFLLQFTEFKAMFVICFLGSIFYAPIISFMEAFSMDHLGKNKKSYGKVRLWGSISFICVTLIMGKALEFYDIKIIIIVAVIGTIIHAIISMFMPPVVNVNRSPAFSNIKLLFKGRIILFFFCSFIMLLSHGTYYGFASIHFEQLGFKSSYIGFFWAIGSTAEIIVMLFSEKIFNKFSIQPILIFSFFVAVLRWLSLYYLTSPALILLTQLSHAITYGAFHVASILYIDQCMPKRAKTLGQAANNSLSYGLGLMVGFSLNGFLFEKIGTFNAFFVSSCIALFGGILLGGFCLFTHKKSNLKQDIDSTKT